MLRATLTRWHYGKTCTIGILRWGNDKYVYTMEDGWHVYSDEELPGGPRPLRIEVAPKQAVRSAGKLVSPEPERDFDQAFAQVTSFFKTTATFRLPVSIDAGAAPGPAVLNLEVTFQACDGRMCLPGRVVKLSAPVTIARAPDRPKK